MYRINDLVNTAKVWQKATVLKYWFASHEGKPGRALEEGEMRHRSEPTHSKTATLAGWSDAAYGDQATAGKRRLGNVIGLTSSVLRGPCHII